MNILNLNQPVITRSLQSQIENSLYKGKVIILYGARRVGKTTLIQQIIANQQQLGKNCRYLNCEFLTNKQMLETTNQEVLYQFLQGYDLVVLDEAQGIKDIGLTLKILIDTYPQIQIIATGSSSFDLANKTGEPLTGRARRFTLYPLGIKEIIDNKLEDKLEIQARLNNILKFGLMPSVYNQNQEESMSELNEIASNYLYKDVLEFEKIRRSELLMTLLQALALQLGGEFTYRELAKMTGTNHNTVKHYLDLLEKCFVIFTLKAYTRRKRKELKVLRQKAFFYDLGLRNAIINNYNQMNLRNDVGGLWENFLILERMKTNQAKKSTAQPYFWKTIENHEVDYIEEQNGEIKAWEFKWQIANKQALNIAVINKDKNELESNKKRKTKGQKHEAEFLSYYPNASFEVVHNQDWLKFVT